MLELRRRFKGEVVALSEYLGRDLVRLWGYDRWSEVRPQLPADLEPVDRGVGERLSGPAVERRKLGAVTGASPRALRGRSAHRAARRAPKRSDGISGTPSRNDSQKASTSRVGSGSRPSTQCGQPCVTQ